MSESKQIKESAAAYLTVEASARRLFPNLSLEQVMAELLLERAQKNLIKYQSAMRRFETKYPQGFEAVRAAVAREEPSAEMEQDYFDWELAVTGVDDMREEIERLKSLSEAA
jgi:hypothetical protein